MPVKYAHEVRVGDMLVIRDVVSISPFHVEEREVPAIKVERSADRIRIFWLWDGEEDERTYYPTQEVEVAKGSEAHR